jgi:hypothetical protein
MKLRIRGNSIRLRLTQSQVETIKNKGFIEEKTEFPNGQNFVYSLSVSATSDSISASFSENKMSIILPESVAENWATGAEVGISAEIESLKILVEKDFKCLTPRTGDEDADTFPHPKETEISC